MQRQRTAPLTLAAALSAAALLLSACGGGGGGPGAVVGSSSGGSSSSSGGSSSGTTAVLAGTFDTHGASLRPIPPATTGGDSIFGAVNSLGNGFFADFSAPAIFSFQPASSNGTLEGFFDAYSGNGSSLGNGLTLQQGDITGTITQPSSGVTQVSATFANSASGFSNQVSITLDHPQLKPVPLTTSKGQYSASYGAGTAITSPGLSSNTSASYAVALDPSNPSFAMTFNGGCASSGSATPDNTYNVYTLQLTVAAGCINNSNVMTLNGLAVYLKAGTASPLNGAPLTVDTLVVELDDSLDASTAPTRALVLLAGRTAGP